MDLFFSFPVSGDRSAFPGPDCGVCVQSEQSVRSPVCPSVWADVRAFIVPPQKEVGSRTGQRVTGRSERSRTRGEAERVRSWGWADAAVQSPVQLKPSGFDSLLSWQTRTWDRPVGNTEGLLY